RGSGRAGVSAQLWSLLGTNYTVVVLHRLLPRWGQPGSQAGGLVERNHLVAHPERQLLEQRQPGGRVRPRGAEAEPAGGGIGRAVDVGHGELTGRPRLADPESLEQITPTGLEARGRLVVAVGDDEALE